MKEEKPFYSFFDALADTAENGGVSVSFHKKGPSLMTMERTLKEPKGDAIAQDFFQIPTTNGSDEYDQDDSAESGINLASQGEEHKVYDNQHRKKRKTASLRFIELFKQDEATIKHRTPRKNPLKKISEEQKKELLDYYSTGNAKLEELRKLFFYLKGKLSRISINDKKESFEYKLCTTTYKTIKTHFNDNKSVTKAFLFAAAYESDEEEIVKTGIQGDGEPLYRLSKKLLTTDLPTLAVALASKEKAITDGILEKEKLEKKLKEVSDTLIKDNTEKSYISESITIIKKSRKQQEADLLAQEMFLQEEIKTLINNSNNLDEDAILGNAHNISAQKNEIALKLNANKLACAELQKNLKNFDTPTKKFGVW